MTARPLRAAAATGVVLGLACAMAWAATIVGANGTFKTTVTKATKNTEKDRIKIEYTADSTKVNCGTIYLVQTCRDVDQNGTLIEPKSYGGDAFKHLQNDMTPGGTYVDHLVCEKDPYYNGEDTGKDKKSAGSTTTHPNAPTSMSDAPAISNGFFPPGVTKIVSTFEVCAVCKDDGKILDCINWKWERDTSDAGKGTITDATAKATPTQEFKDALKLYVANHKDGTVCPEQAAEENKPRPEVKPGNAKKTPDPVVANQPFQTSWDIQNAGLVPVSGVQYFVMLDGAPLTSGKVPFIPPLDHQLVLFSCPPLPPGPHQLLMIVDPGNAIPEFDETDNQATDEFTVGGTNAIGDEPVAVVNLAIDPVWPQPTRGDFSIRFRLASPEPARIDIIDVRGRRVHSLLLNATRPGSREVQFALRGQLEPGMYWVRVAQGQRWASTKVSVVR